MGDVINLRQARKARERADKDAAAAANRIRHGRTKADKVRQKTEDAIAIRALDGKKLEPEG